MLESQPQIADAISEEDKENQSMNSFMVTEQSRECATARENDPN
jgi:hypothetical protein